jgi:O-antigen ligase
MTATTMTVSGENVTPGLDRVASWLLFAMVASLQFSIAAANILLTAVLICWSVLLVRERRRPAAPPFFLGLAAYAAITLVAVMFSLNATISLADSKQLLLFLIVPVVFQLAHRERTTTIVDVLLAAGAISAAYGIVVQYGLQQHDNLSLRIKGVMDHYMTYSGVLMLVLCAAAARLMFGARDRVWPALVIPALVVAISLTLTRSAWVGMCVAVGVLCLLKDFRLIVLVPVAIVLVYLVAPAVVTSRMLSTFDLADPSNRDRLAMARAGAGMIRDFPLTGVGPDMVKHVYAEYRPPDAVQPLNPHLHNVPLQIAAERGLPALAIWLAFVAALAAALLRQFRRQRDQTLAATGLAAIAAMLGAGMFEYNFGDSEFLMVFLVLVTLPFAAARADQAADLAADHAAATARS